VSSNIGELLRRYRNIIVIGIAVAAIASYVIPFNGMMITRPATGQTPGEGGPYGNAGPCEADDDTPTPGCTDIGLPQNPICELDDNTQAGCEGGPGATTPGTTGPSTSSEPTTTPGSSTPSEPTTTPGSSTPSEPTTTDTGSGGSGERDNGGSGTSGSGGSGERDNGGSDKSGSGGSPTTTDTGSGGSPTTTDTGSGGSGERDNGGDSGGSSGSPSTQSQDRGSSGGSSSEPKEVTSNQEKDSR
jgi:hypothetical protein